jgi:nitrogen regulatory protein P-II 1
LEYQTIQTILQTCYTKDFGDGMIFVSDINESYRIDDQQLGEQALDFNTI